MLDYSTMALLILVLAGSLLSLHVGASVLNPIVETKLGKINGLSCEGGDAVAMFLGIPYAKPPVRRFRWTAPSKYISKYAVAGLNATAPGPRCRQGSEVR